MRRRLIAIMTIATVALFASEAWTKSFPINRVSKASLEGSCKAAGGVSIGFSAGGYGCVNHNCDGKGNDCAVHCNKSGCYGHTPIVSHPTADGVLGKQPAASTSTNRRPLGGGLLETGGAGSMQTGGPAAGGAAPRAPAAAPAGGRVN
jgi:hypothetical protein